jgi:hypothetical protein
MGGEVSALRQLNSHHGSFNNAVAIKQGDWELATYQKDKQLARQQQAYADGDQAEREHVQRMAEQQIRHRADIEAIHNKEVLKKEEHQEDLMDKKARARLELQQDRDDTRRAKKRIEEAQQERRQGEKDLEQKDFIDSKPHTAVIF